MPDGVEAFSGLWAKMDEHGSRWPLGEPLTCDCHRGWPKPKAWACEYGGVHRTDGRHGRGSHHAVDLPLYTVRQVEEIKRRGGVVGGRLVVQESQP